MSTGNLPYEFALPKGTPPELITAIKNTVRDTFNRHGAAAFEMSRDAAILHETGHTIVAAHEGVNFQSVRVFSRTVPLFGNVWGGWCAEKDKEWTTGPDTSIESDLSRARIIIGGLAGEVVCGLDKPGSSLDELLLSQFVGLNAAKKLDDYTPTDEYNGRFWNERVWKVAFEILVQNSEPFKRLAKHLDQHETVNGGKLHAILAQVRRIAP